MTSVVNCEFDCRMRYMTNMVTSISQFHNWYIVDFGDWVTYILWIFVKFGVPNSQFHFDIQASWFLVLYINVHAHCDHRDLRAVCFFIHQWWTLMIRRCLFILYLLVYGIIQCIRVWHGMGMNCLFYWVQRLVRSVPPVRMCCQFTPTGYIQHCEQGFENTSALRLFPAISLDQPLANLNKI